MVLVKCTSLDLLAVLSSVLTVSLVAGSGSNGSSVPPAVAADQVLVVSRLCREENYYSTSALPSIHAAAADVMHIAALSIYNATSNLEVVRIQSMSCMLAQAKGAFITTPPKASIAWISLIPAPLTLKEKMAIACNCVTISREGEG